MTDRPTGHLVPTDAEGGAADASFDHAREPTHAERCKTLVASETRGALSTIAAQPEGYPYGSVASYGLDARGNPLLFVSTMAEHTQNALRDPRASLLVAEPVPDGADPLASGRVTLMGEMRAVDPSDRDLARERYLDANPAAAYYIEFGDFDFYRLTVQSIRYVGGYGHMSWVDPDDYAAAEPDPLVGAAAGIIEHMQKSVRVNGTKGSPWRATEAALRMIESGRYPLEKLHTHTIPLDETEHALQILAGEVPGEQPIHITITP